MEILVKMADNLNKLLNVNQMDSPRLEKICQTLKEQLRVKFKLMDFEFFNEERMAVLRTEKKQFTKEKNYEDAASKQELMNECQKHIRFKKYFKLKKSIFYPEDNKLVYLHTGKSKNDPAIYAYLTSIETGIFKSPRND